MAGKDQTDMQKVVLPPELWKEILLKLWQSEDDLEHLRTCRKVCRSWEELMDTMPPNLYWNPWFSDSEHRYHQNDTFIFHPATSFTRDLDVTEFLNALPTPGSVDAEKNPFRNQTVRLFRYRYEYHPDDVNNEEENLLMILKEHGHRIRKLLWEPHNELPERLMTLPLLLSGLINLRTLIIDSMWLSHANKKIIRGEDFPKDLNHLRELVFQCSYHDGDPDDTLYGKLSVNYGQQIRSITFSSFLDFDISKKNVLDCYPNLEDLKVNYLHVDYWKIKQPSGNPWPKVRRMALSSGNEEGSVVFINVLRLVRCFSETLELLSLQFDLSKEKIDRQNRYNEPAVFPKLGKLILPLSTVYNGSLRQPITIPIERRLNFGFPALKSVVLEDMKNEFGYRETLHNVNPIDICETLWPFVPSSVETISTRNTWESVWRGRAVVKTYNCSRNPIG